MFHWLQFSATCRQQPQHTRAVELLDMTTVAKRERSWLWRRTHDGIAEFQKVLLKKAPTKNCTEACCRDRNTRAGPPPSGK